MTGYTLPKALILKKSEQFREIIQNGINIQSECFAVYYLPNKQLQFGFTVSKKVENKPDRNRLKRILREAVRLCFREYELCAGIVLIANSNMRKISHEKVLSEIRRILLQIEKAAK